MTATVRVGLIAATALACFSAAEAQPAPARFVEAHGVFSIAAPTGWSRAEANFDGFVFKSPGGSMQGAIWVNLFSAGATVDETADNYAKGAKVSGRRTLTIDSVPCVIFQATYAENAHDAVLVCNITIPFKTGPVKAAFYAGGNAPVDKVEQMTAALQELAGSVIWGQGVGP